jgi:DNA-binding LacI/PurR family transcriptional regulator
VCFDDLYFAPLLEPSLTAIAYDARSIGSAGARLLLAAAEDQTPRWSEVRVDVGLVCRRSCGCDYDPAADLEEAIG